MDIHQNERRLRHFLEERKIDILFLVAGAALGITFDWTIVEIVIFLCFLWSFLGPISSRLLAGFSIFFFLFVPVFLIFDRMDRAEEFSIYTYYFLVMAVIRAIIEVRSEEKA